MTRSELIAELAASNPYLRTQDAEVIVATVFEQIASALVRGQWVEVAGRVRAVGAARPLHTR